MSPMSILITKKVDMKENSTSNDATRQWRQFARNFCKLWSHVWNKGPVTFEMDGLFELRSMLRAKNRKKKKKNKKKKDTAHKRFLSFFFFKFSTWYLPAKQTCHNWIFWILLLILLVIALEAGARASLRAQNIINIILVGVPFFPHVSAISKELYLHDGSAVLTE